MGLDSEIPLWREAVGRAEEEQGGIPWQGVPYLPVLYGALPLGDLVDVLQPPLALVDELGHVLHGIQGSLHVLEIPGDRHSLVVMIVYKNPFSRISSPGKLQLLLVLLF